ncbi:helix-turn-helix transcriptional regulator [Polaromonas sp. P2-4]|nr:helix-turn-helix transcriptional regulator [Polaromonas sp. P2-4]
MPAYMPHRIASDAMSVVDLLIEPETVVPTLLPDVLCQSPGLIHAPELAQRVRQLLLRLQVKEPELPNDDAGFDRMLFGEVLPRPQRDGRIQAVLDDIDAQPEGGTAAEVYAQGCHLSASRFVHLFKQETGIPLRTLRMWKRARSLLHCVNQRANLADIALLAGYPDSTHFSHSVRTVYGLSPKDMFAGSRELELLGATTVPMARPRRN